MTTGKAKLGIAIGVVVLVSFAMIFLPAPQFILELVEWIRDAGWSGIVVFGLFYVAATLLFLPGSVLTAAAGFAWGVVGGTLVVSPASMLGATAAFLTGRHFARNAIAARIQGNARFDAIDRAVEQNGFKIVLLLRLSPVVPFNLLNYALGITRVRLSDYLLASFIGMLPGTVLYVYLGTLATRVAELAGGRRHDVGWAGQALHWGGLAATIVATILITRLARRALRTALAEDVHA